ncbi:transcription antitermination factor NusB [Kordia sp. YSTF-M3]|uniref:Transcription antitermination factor NusB n=1 Tax=Kordia aestuariivivens TaxID=2759037 RepID=A0ABR7QFJ3_9FLAO|nr:transcription antitermination factor NusB [Kordia aestuariivivens]MBC8757332.1 transcription antitermination factor NusB [Kordia aestuariivivens]
MQSIYALSQSQSDQVDKELKFINMSIANMHDLHILTLDLFVKLSELAQKQIELSKKKYLATSAEKNPNKKFLQNAIIQHLIQNEDLKAAVYNRKLNDWELNDEYVRVIFDAMLASDIYEEYMDSEETSYEKDRTFVAKLFSEVIAPNEKLYEYFEDQKLTWLDDLPVVNTLILKSIKQSKPGKERIFLSELYKDDEDREFVKDLFMKTMLNDEMLTTEIQGKTPNWDKDRIANLDLIVLKMAICEFLKFPSIPAKVTINEYIELAKEYSTSKSSMFVNGILDKLIKEYKKENKLNKIGRGLM